MSPSFLIKMFELNRSQVQHKKLGILQQLRKIVVKMVVEQNFLGQNHSHSEDFSRSSISFFYNSVAYTTRINEIIMIIDVN
jgi:hypothetical protein